MFLGLSERGYGLVFSGLQTTAKNFFTETLKDIPVEEYRQEVANFLLHLADGIQYLHYKQLVHPEVSVESVLVVSWIINSFIISGPNISNLNRKDRRLCFWRVSQYLACGCNGYSGCVIF